MGKKKIIFVCTGNTCRSVMAEALARDIVQNVGTGDLELEITSAGTTALPGVPASDRAVKVLHSMGIDIEGRASRFLEKEDVCSADLVLAMTGDHCRQVREMAPECADRVFTLAGYSGVGGDVPDPFGASEDTYRLCASELSIMVKKALERFLAGSENNPGEYAPGD